MSFRSSNFIDVGRLCQKPKTYEGKEQLIVFATMYKSKKVKEEWVKIFYNLKIFGKQAEFFLKYFGPKMPVIVSGTLSEAKVMPGREYVQPDIVVHTINHILTKEETQQLGYKTYDQDGLSAERGIKQGEESFGVSDDSLSDFDNL